MEKVITTEQQDIPAPISLSAKELQDARQMINIFILAWKNYGLYPEDHITSIKAFENLVTKLGNFFSTHGDLRLAVEKNRLLWESEILHEVSQDAPSGDIISLLYRDGIKWIEFQEGLTLEEITSFFRIAYKYRLFAEETDGDVVTALMDEELEYIDFKAVDIFWQDLLLTDFSQLPPPAPQPEETGDQEETDRDKESDESGGKEIYARSIADPSISNNQLELSGEDFEILQQMVQEEENWSVTEDLFEVLMIILKSQIEREKFTEVLDFVSEQVVETIKLDEFDLLIKLLQSLHRLYSLDTLPEKDWKRPLISRFFKNLSNPENFQLISEKLLKLQMSEIEKVKAFRLALRYFSPQIIPYLVPVIIERSSEEILQMVSKVILQLSQRDIEPLEKAATKHGMEMGDKLLNILNHLQGDRANKILFTMCNHPSDKVRKKSIQMLIERDPKYAQKLFSLIDDPRKDIRNCILAAFVKNRSNVLENMLLKYLKENSAKKDSSHILACYEALGHCGSKTSVPYLSRTLLNQGWNSFMGSGKLIFREGAAIALTLLDTPDAKDSLHKASVSKFKVIRKAYDKTKTVTVSGENTNG